MESTTAIRVLSKQVLTALIAVTLFVSPWNSVDPVNLPKLTILGIFAFTFLGLLVSNKFSLFRIVDFKLRILTMIFLGQIILSALLNKGDLSFKIFGTPNRNTGLLTYFSLAILMVAAASVGTKTFRKQFVYTLIGVASLLSIYGLAQWQGLEIFQYVNVYGSNVFSTLGNTNFHSAFMGIAGSTIFALIFAGSLKLKSRLLLLATFLLFLANIFLSSSQGFLSLAGGCSVTLIVYFVSNKKYSISVVLSALVAIGTSLVTMAIFNFGPLAGIIYEVSLKARGFYWDAAINMLVKHPFVGVGIDGYGDWYLRSRSQTAAQYNYGLTSDSAHNIPLDIGTSGGILLLLAYLGIQGLVVNRVIKIVKIGEGIDPIFLSILAAWTAYQIQSLISINQIGLGIWGWVMSGLLIGYGNWTTSETLPKSLKQRKGNSAVIQKLSSESLILCVLGCVLGASISLPPYIAANKFYQSMQSGRIEELIKGADFWPADRSRYFYVAQILMENKFEGEAIPILKEASLRYPDYFPIWQKLVENPKSNPDLLAKAKAERRRLDPLNPEFKK